MHADPNNPPIMIFLKFFDCAGQTLLGKGKVFVSKNSKVSDLIPVIQQKEGWPSSTPIKFYEVSSRHRSSKTQPDEQEIKAGMIEGMKLKQTYAQNEIQDGDIICYQVEMTPKE
jgi:ubiquitin carboxyl-terminal hydrolase 7